MKTFTRSRINRPSSGFTLIELLIVVVILGILAAVLVPQLSGVTDDAEIGARDTTLASLQSAIDLYESQHGHYPGTNVSSGGACPTSSAEGNGTAGSANALGDQLALYTNKAGQACTKSDATFKYGPYIKSKGQVAAAAIPKNPVTDSNTLVILSDGSLILTSDGGATGGWKYDRLSGVIIANDS